MNKSFSDKFERTIERLLVPLATKMNSQRHLIAIRDAFVLAFPLTMAASMIILLNFVLLSPDGFVANLLNLGEHIPNLADYQAIFTPVIKGSTDILALIIVFLIARNLAVYHQADDILTGITALAVYFIIYPPYEEVDGANFLSTGFLGAQGLFVAIFVGLSVGELMAWLSKSDKLRITMPDQVPPAVSRSFRVLIPIFIILVGFSILNFFIMKVSPGGLHQLVYDTLQKPLTKLGSSIGSVVSLAIISNFLWILGIHGPNTIAAVRDTMFAEATAANTQYINAQGTPWGAPFPITWGGLNDAFANYGGSGMTLGLIIAIFLVSKRQEDKDIAKLSLAPGLFNINESIVFGLPIVMNPIYIIPFILVPVINILVGYFFIKMKIIPPVVYGVPWTTPGPLIPFLGTGGNFIALLVGFLTLAISVLIYMPFVMASNKVSEHEEV